MRRFRWRTWEAFGRHPLDEVFDTPTEAGRWRREHFGDSDQPLTLEVLVDGKPESPTLSEMFEAHLACFGSRVHT